MPCGIGSRSWLPIGQRQLEFGNGFQSALKIALGIRVDSDADRVPSLIGGHLRVDALLVAETRLGPTQYLKVHPAEPNLIELLLNVPPQKIVTRQVRAAFGRNTNASGPVSAEMSRQFATSPARSGGNAACLLPRSVFGSSGRPGKRVERSRSSVNQPLPSVSARISPGRIPTKTASKKMILSRKSSTDNANRTCSLVIVRLAAVFASFGVTSDLLDCLE